ncbi:Thioredoxin Y, chloroplastic [Porphyridium purpureum]|uniref:Thioredoxin Y, chloroplastic n=1 Tax=Porphyridium purpureum TaxID=35688 RepID=A0A5J4Z3S5_PORPP|nr:Thioredoxin Y, chloroplastic [Porphyridium purpureum]|eukprot:POR0549..scf295_1
MGAMAGFVAGGGARVDVRHAQMRSQCAWARGAQAAMVRPARRAAALQMVRKVNSEELEVELQNLGEMPMIVDFYATWCGPCQFLVPELEKLEKQYAGRIKILKVDSDEEADLCTALKIRGLPTLMFIQSGTLKYRMEGALAAEQLAMISEQADRNPQRFIVAQEKLFAPSMSRVLPLEPRIFRQRLTHFFHHHCFYRRQDGLDLLTTRTIPDRVCTFTVEQNQF